ncbi:hypothetical protein EMCRGX_G017349 [Ephydatia muelleri]
MAGYLPTRLPAVPVVLPSLLSMHYHVQKVAFLSSGTMRSETILPISCQKSATTFQLSLIFNPSQVRGLVICWRCKCRAEQLTVAEVALEIGVAHRQES